MITHRDIIMVHSINVGTTLGVFIIQEDEDLDTRRCWLFSPCRFTSTAADAGLSLPFLLVRLGIDFCSIIVVGLLFFGRASGDFNL